MRKWIISIIMVLVMIQVAQAIKDCQGVMNSRDLPCLLISRWNYTCAGESATIYNEVPNFLRTSQLADYGITGRCNSTYGENINETLVGSYVIDWSKGDSSTIIIEEDDEMILGTVIGVGIVAALLLFFAFKLDEEHQLLKILFMISSITLLILIPIATFITTTSNAGKIFFRTFLYIFGAFWIYIFIYFTRWILQKLGLIATGEEDND